MTKQTKSVFDTARDVYYAVLDIAALDDVYFSKRNAAAADRARNAYYAAIDGLTAADRAYAYDRARDAYYAAIEAAAEVVKV